MNKILEIKNLSKNYQTIKGEIKAIDNISFALDNEEVLCIVGSSGCGKSTLLELIAGLIPIETGSLLYPACNKTPAIGYMLQKDLLLPWRTIADNIVLPKTLHGTRRQAALKSAVSDIAACGLRDLLNRRPDECSGGQRQRLSIARAIAKNPKLLLCDEPTGALDYQTGKQVLQLLQDTCRRDGITVLIITHNSALAPMADRLIRFKSGRVTSMEKNANPVPIANIEW